MRKKVLMAGLVAVIAFNLVGFGFAGKSMTIVDDAAGKIEVSNVKIVEDDTYHEKELQMDINVKNKSDKDGYYYTSELYINGVKFPASTTVFGLEKKDALKAGKSDKLKSTDVGLPEEYIPMIEEMGDITDIQLSAGIIDIEQKDENGLEVWNYAAYHADVPEKLSVAKGTEHIYPKGKNKATVYQRKEGKNDVVIVDNDEVKMTVVKQDYEKADDMANYNAMLYIENKTKRPIYYEIKNEFLDDLKYSDNEKEYPGFNVAGDLGTLEEWKTFNRTLNANENMFFNLNWYTSKEDAMKVLDNLEKIGLGIKVNYRDGEKETIIDDSYTVEVNK